MKSKIIRLAIVCGLLLSCVPISSASEVQSRSAQFIPNSVMENARYMQDVDSMLKITKQEYQNLSNAVSQNKKRLEELKEEIVSLEDQLKNLDLLAKQTEAKILNVMKQMTQKRNDMHVLAEHIDDKNMILDEQVELLKNYAKFLYVQDKEFLDYDRILLAGDSVSELLQEKQYMEILQEEGQDLAEDLKDVSFELDQNKKALIVKSAHLASLKERLADEQAILAEQKEAKIRLLDATKGEEDIYFELLAESKAQQNSTLNDVNTLQNNLVFLQEKIKEFGASFDLDNYRGLISKRSRSVFEYQNATQNTGEIAFSWPVNPSRGISAYFLDNSYKAVFGVPHYAIDVKVPQLTPVLAPADGIAYRVKDNDTGYSYIILAHRSGFMTVYGHIYEMKVQEGQIVNKGDVIGLSGGMPGTKGAGYMTTGPHLHFEIIKNGQNVDPMDYLPLIQLPLDTLPEKYANRLRGEIEERRESGRDIITEEDLDSFIESEGKYGYEGSLDDLDIEELIDFE